MDSMGRGQVTRQSIGLLPTDICCSIATVWPFPKANRTYRAEQAIRAQGCKLIVGILTGIVYACGGSEMKASGAWRWASAISHLRHTIRQLTRRGFPYHRAFAARQMRVEGALCRLGS